MTTRKHIPSECVWVGPMTAHQTSLVLIIVTGIKFNLACMNELWCCCRSQKCLSTHVLVPTFECASQTFMRRVSNPHCLIQRIFHLLKLLHLVNLSFGEAVPFGESFICWDVSSSGSIKENRPQAPHRLIHLVGCFSFGEAILFHSVMFYSVQ